MDQLGFSRMKSLDQFRSFNRSGSATAKTFAISSRPSSDSISYGSFANLKLTAEKLIKEQASVKTDLEMARSKLKKSEEQIRTLEGKLQDTSNENAKLTVKQKEDAKLWKGLDSKLSSTKTLCDQLTETVQQLAAQVREAEEAKKLFGEKLSASSKAFDDLNIQINALSSKIESAEETVRNGQQELKMLRHEKEETEKSLSDECRRTDNLVKEKDAAIKQLEATIEEDKVGIRSLNFHLQEMQHDLGLKEEVCKCLRATQETLEKEKIALESSNEDFAHKLHTSGLEIKNLEDSVHCLVSKLVELDKQSAAVSNNVVQLTSAFDSCYKLAQQEKLLALEHAQQQFDQLHKQFVHVTSENDTFRSEIVELKNKVTELQKIHEFVMVQHAEECHLAEEKIKRLGSETEALVSKKVELETSVTKSEKKIEQLLESLTGYENQTRDLSRTISSLESANQDNEIKVQLMLKEKTEEIETLQREIEKSNQHVISMENQISQLCDSLDKKEELHLHLKDREKQLEEERVEIRASLAASESTLVDARKQYDLMLEGKQLELTKHIKEISQRNDQAINDIRRKYEVEKLEIVNAEKEKADQLIKEIQKECDEKITVNKEEAHQHLMRLQEEHGALINRIQQEHDKKEQNLRAHHNEELQRVQLQAENELQEKGMSLRKEHEVQIKALRHQHEDECRKLQEELDVQKSKEEKQRALLQLQWKVMDANQNEDQEINSKEYSVSSIKKMDADGGKGGQLATMRPDNGSKDVNFLGTRLTPVANLLKKVDKGNTGSQISIPKHSKKVTRHEYEVETSNGRTITKRRKTKSTVMFGDPTAHKGMNKKNSNVRKDAGVRKVIKGARTPPSNMGDLFTEGSLNPYADDPYAFD